MSLYAMIHGRNPAAPLILATLDLTTDDVGRFRDAFVSEGRIAVYTRNGGGNRECWNDNTCNETCAGCIIEKVLPRHPNYLYDEDDDFDCTYATVYFSFPERHRDLLEALDTGEFDPSARWLEALDALRDGKRPEVVEAFRPIMEKIVELADPEADQGGAGPREEQE